MHWKAGLVALLFLGSATAQTGGLPGLPDPGDLPGTSGLPAPGVPDPGVAPVPGGVESMVPDPSHPALRIPAGSAEPGAPLLEYQHAIWRDGEHLRGVPRDGYDLIALRAWEVDEYDVGAGLMLRLEVAGNALAGADQYVVEGDLVVLESNATPSIFLWTEDGETWQSDDIIVAQSVTATAAPGGLPAPQRHVIHVLVTYDSLNATVGQTIAGWAFSASTDVAGGVQLTDVAPGGYYVAAAVELPEPNAAGDLDAESSSATASEPPALFLRGAGQHIDIEGQWDDGVATMTISNPYLETAQFVALAYPEGATPYAATNGTIAANASMQFQFAVPQRAAAYTAQWDVRSDIGGVAQVQVNVPAIPPSPEEPDPEPEPEPIPMVRTDLVAAAPEPEPDIESTPTPSSEESPGLAPALLIAVLAVALWVRRQR